MSSLWNPTAPSYAMEDVRFADRVKWLIAEDHIECIVETGVNVGKSTLAFALLNGPKVIGIDVDLACLASAWGMLSAAQMLGHPMADWQLHLGDSADALRSIVGGLPDKTFYFLDAHWQADRWPLLEELGALPRGKGVIAIHDFGTPGHENFGHCQLGTGERLTYEYVREALVAWSPTHRVEYTEVLDGIRPAVAWVFSQ